MNAQQPLSDPTQRGKKYDPSLLTEKIGKSRFGGMEFRLWTNEKVYTDELRKVGLSDATGALHRRKKGKSGFSPLILRILSSLGGAAQIDVLAEMFLMYAGRRASAGDFVDGLKELLSLSVVNFGTLARGPQKKLRNPPVRAMRFVFISNFGAAVLSALFGERRPLINTNARTIDAAEVKSALISSRIICRMLKEKLLSNFRFRATHSLPPRPGKRKRPPLKSVPLYTLNLKGSEIIFFSFRKEEHWEDKVISELVKICRIYSKKAPTILLSTEDFLMSTEIFKAVAGNSRIRANIIFTDDITFLNSSGKQFIYTVGFDGKNFKRKLLGK